MAGPAMARRYAICCTTSVPGTVWRKSFGDIRWEDYGRVLTKDGPGLKISVFVVVLKA